VPPKDGASKEALPLRVSPEVRSRLGHLQELRGSTSLSEAATDALIEGLISLEDKAFSAENKRLINQRLKAKLAGAIEAVATLEDLAPTLDPTDRATVAQAVALLRAWLSE
jgi:uncharacterized membrane protein YccC